LKNHSPTGNGGRLAARPTTAQVIQTNISFAVNAAGEISPAEQVSVRPEINGRIEALPVDLGDRVKKSDLLFKLDDAELQQQRASNLTAIERAKLELEKAERDFKRAQHLLNDKLIRRSCLTIPGPRTNWPKMPWSVPERPRHH